MEKLDSIKQTYNISEVFPLEPIILNKKKVYLFFGKEQEVNYSLYTDGNIEHLDTWCDKKPYDRDVFLEGCKIDSSRWIDRFEFEITDANVLMVEKKFQNKVMRNLYINQDSLDKIILDRLYQVVISSKGKIMIKKIGEQ